MTEGKRLHRSLSNRMIAGVCGGVGEFFDIDPTLIRLLWFFSIFLGGTGLILYIVAMIIMPVNPSPVDSPTKNSRSRMMWGITLIGVGTLVLLYNVGIAPFLWWSIPWQALFAIVLIVIGVGLILSHVRGGSAWPETLESDPGHSLPRRRLYRSIHDRKIFGVCGGLGELFRVDPTIIRLLFVFLTLCSIGFGLIIYVLLAIVTPEERLQTTAA